MHSRWYESLFFRCKKRKISLLKNNSRSAMSEAQHCCQKEQTHCRAAARLSSHWVAEKFRLFFTILKFTIFISFTHFERDWGRERKNLTCETSANVLWWVRLLAAINLSIFKIVFRLPLIYGEKKKWEWRNTKNLFSVRNAMRRRRTFILSGRN